MSTLKKKLIRFLSGKPSDEGQALFDAWYNSFNDDDSAIDKASEDQISHELKKIKSSGVKPLYKSENASFFQWRIAAALAILALAGAAVYLQWEQIIGIVDPIKYAEEVTPKGSRAQLTLSDGSKVWLNAGSKLRYPEEFKRGSREVFLEGEAYFEVAHDAERPFIIHTEKLATTVLGTSFNVRAHKNEDQEVGVLSGKVSVAKIPTHNQAEQLILLPLQKAVLENRTEQLVQLQIHDASHYTSWKDGRIIADDLSVKDLITQLERTYDARIELADESLGTCRVTAEFNTMPLERLLDLLNAILYTTYSKKNDRYIIEGSGCNS